MHFPWRFPLPLCCFFLSHDRHNQIPENSEDVETEFLTAIWAGWMFQASIPHCYPMNVWLCVLTIGTGSLQVRYDSENVVHQVWSLFVLQYAARGGVGWVYIRQIGQVHPWNKAADRKRWNVLHWTRWKTQPPSHMLSALIELRALVRAKWGKRPSVAGGALNTSVNHVIEPNFHRYMVQVPCSCVFLGVKTSW